MARFTFPFFFFERGTSRGTKKVLAIFQPSGTRRSTIPQSHAPSCCPYHRRDELLRGRPRQLHLAHVRSWAISGGRSLWTGRDSDGVVERLDRPSLCLSFLRGDPCLPGLRPAVRWHAGHPDGHQLYRSWQHHRDSSRRGQLHGHRRSIGWGRDLHERAVAELHLGASEHAHDPRGTAIFGYVQPPTVVAVTPPAGPAAGGVQVLILGTGFAAPLFARIGASPCAPVTFLTPTSFNCTVGPGTAGPAPVTVTSAGVASAPGSALFFTFEPAAPAPVTPALPTPPNGTAPFVSSVAPVSGSVNGGVVITLLGFNLGNDAIDCAAVQVGPLACSSISWSSPTMVLCSTPPAPTSGPAAVSARTRSGGPGPAGPSYTYAPHVIGVFPRDLQYAGGDVITVIGRGFGLANAAPPAEVAIQGVACSTTAFSSESMLVCTTPSFAKVGPR